MPDPMDLYVDKAILEKISTSEVDVIDGQRASHQHQLHYLVHCQFGSPSVRAKTFLI